jgi:MFS family permease
VGFGVAMGALALAPNQPVAFVIGLFMGVTSISFMTASTAIVQLTSTPSMRGRVLALQAMVFLGSTPIGGPIVGTISQRFGARYSLGLGAVATVAAGVFGVLRVRSRARADRIFVEEVDATGRSLGDVAEPSLLDPVISPRAS